MERCARGVTFLRRNWYFCCDRSGRRSVGRLKRVSSRRRAASKAASGGPRGGPCADCASRCAESVNKGSVSFDAPCRLSSFPFQRPAGSGGDRGRLDRHGVAALCVARPGGNNVGRLGARLCGQPGHEPAACRGSGQRRKSAPGNVYVAADGHCKRAIWLESSRWTSASSGSSSTSALTGTTSARIGALRANTATWNYGLTVTQNLFNGNRTVNGVRQAESNIFGARETMRNTEESTLLNGATAYMNVLATPPSSIFAKTTSSSFKSNCVRQLIVLRSAR